MGEVDTVAVTCADSRLVSRLGPSRSTANSSTAIPAPTRMSGGESRGRWSTTRPGTGGKGTGVLLLDFEAIDRPPAPAFRPGDHRRRAVIYLGATLGQYRRRPARARRAS